MDRAGGQGRGVHDRGRVIDGVSKTGRAVRVIHCASKTGRAKREAQTSCTKYKAHTRGRGCGSFVCFVCSLFRFFWCVPVRLFVRRPRFVSRLFFASKECKRTNVNQNLIEHKGQGKTLYGLFDSE